MDVILKCMILLGVIELGFGIVSTIRGYNILASVRQPPSAFAGVAELIIGVFLVAIGIVATRAWSKR